MDNDMSPTWKESEALIVEKVTRHELNLIDLGKKFDRMMDSQTEILVEVAKLKVKSGIWGFIGGAIPILVGVLWILLKS